MKLKSIASNHIKDSSSLFKKIYFYKNIDSTNNKCFKLKDKNNFIVIADKQTRGRGRYDRNWHSPAGKNLYFSLLIHKPVLDYNEICILTSAAVLEVLEKYDPDICLKWPNDIIYKNKKISGILIERKFTGNILKFVVIGVGINIFTDFSRVNELKDIAVSLGEILEEGDMTGHTSVTRAKEERPLGPEPEGSRGYQMSNNNLISELLISFLKLFEKYYLNYAKYQKKITNKWMKNSSRKNEMIQFKIHNKIIKGIFKKVNPDGSIILKTGKIEKTYNFGEIV